VAFIVAGFTGLSTALLLEQDRVEVAIVNAETPFWGGLRTQWWLSLTWGALASEKTRITRLGEAKKPEFRRCEKGRC
jgi:glycine/D-amino acid oxidase-like deaminating enzyme